MLTIRAMSNGEGYAARHLAHSDYYAEGERVVGQWFGRGAQLLGLSGEVQFQDFEAVREGLNPRTGEFLRQRHSADRMAADGSTRSHGRSLYDFTFSAPKSVSILAELTGDQRLIQAHQRAVAEALTELESHAATGVRRAGASHDRTTGNLVLAVYDHDTSRELDPQIHTHAVAANMTWDGTEGRWKALQAYSIYSRRAYLTEVYRNALAREVLKLGYEIDDRRNRGFEIRHVSEDLISKYSQRSKQRDQAIQEFIRKYGHKPTDNEVAVLVRETRAEKLIEISTAAKKAQQLDRLAPDEAHALNSLRRSALGIPVTENRSQHSAPQSLSYAQQHTYERISVARDHELLAEALRHGRGYLNLSELKATLSAHESSGSILRAGDEVATRESLDREHRMIARINEGVGRVEALNSGFVPSTDLQKSPQRTRAVQFILSAKDWAVNLRGAPGTGKTITLQEIQRGIREAGGQVLAVAPTRSAVEELQKVGFPDAITIERLLQDRQAQRSLQGKVLIVDEAGMVSGRQMEGLLHTAKAHAARIIFSGDTRQIQSVEASDALRILEKESNLQSTSLTKVERQTNPEYREAVEELRRNPARGFEKLEQMGAVHEVSFDDRAAAIVQAYRAASNHINRKREPSSVLVVAPTHDEIARVTEAIRTHRKATGELTRSIITDRYVSLQFTRAQKTDSHNYRPGQVLVFHRSTKDIARNQALEVVHVLDRKIVARSENGLEYHITARQAGAFDVFERRQIEVAIRDRLLLTGNRRDRDFRATNGELVTVSGFDAQGRIQLEDGRILPANFKQFSHGYVVTAHRSQGKTVDALVISSDWMSKELFQVAATRGRERIEIITGNTEVLKESIGISAERQSATELERKIQDSTRGRNLALQLAREEALSTLAHTAEFEFENRNQPHHLAQNVSKGTQHELYY